MEVYIINRTEYYEGTVVTSVFGIADNEKDMKNLFKECEKNTTKLMKESLKESDESTKLSKRWDTYYRDYVIENENQNYRYSITISHIDNDKNEKIVL